MTLVTITRRTWMLDDIDGHHKRRLVERCGDPSGMGKYDREAEQSDIAVGIVLEPNGSWLNTPMSAYSAACWSSRLDAEVIDAGGGIGIDNRLGAAPAQRLVGRLNHRRVQVGQGVIVGNRWRGHIQVNVGFRARGEVRSGLEHAHARHGQVLGQEGEEGGVGEGGVVGDGVEMPLVGHAQGEHSVGVGGQQDGVGAQQLRIGARPAG